MLIDMQEKRFSDRVIEAVQSIPKGKVTTYGRIARAAGGGTMASQSITSILSKAEKNGVKHIPYHRIVYANGTIWINDTYKKERLALYKKEGIEIDIKGRIIDFEKKLFEFY